MPVGLLSQVQALAGLRSELQKDYFCPVSGFSTGKCPNHVFGQFCHNLRHKSNHRLLFF